MAKRKSARFHKSSERRRLSLAPGRAKLLALSTASIAMGIQSAWLAQGWNATLPTYLDALEHAELSQIASPTSLLLALGLGFLFVGKLAAGYVSGALFSQIMGARQGTPTSR